MLRKALILKHVQQSGLARVVETQEENLGILVGETCGSRALSSVTQEVGWRTPLAQSAESAVADAAHLNEQRVDGTRSSSGASESC